MKQLASVIARTPFLGRSLLALYRAKITVKYVARPFAYFVKWLLTSRETTNLTYDIEDINKQYLACLIAEITNRPFNEIMAYSEEPERDADLLARIANAVARADMGFKADKQMHFGRRLGWYALARALKPKVIVETGVDKGLGSCLLAAALKRNNQEGHAGQYFGTDINPSAGYLLSGEYAEYGRILYGDSIESLQKFDAPIDLFINDSDHSPLYEAREYETVTPKLAEHAFILGDSSDWSDKLLEFSLATHRRFVFFQEKPKGHFYPGEGIGISFRK